MSALLEIAATLMEMDMGNYQEQKATGHYPLILRPAVSSSSKAITVSVPWHIPSSSSSSSHHPILLLTAPDPLSLLPPLYR
jgi:hypothetical protein